MYGGGQYAFFRGVESLFILFLLPLGWFTETGVTFWFLGTLAAVLISGIGHGWLS